VLTNLPITVFCGVLISLPDWFIQDLVEEAQILANV
jgi:hypothetical protein